MKLLLVVLLFITSVSFGKDRLIDSKDENISWVGRVDFNPKHPEFAHAGIQIKFKFKGTSLKVGLQDISDGTAENLNFYNVYINGKKIDSIEVSSGKEWYPIQFEFNHQEVEIELFKRTEAMCAAGRFTGLKVNEGATISKVKLPSRRIEWVGDSFTAGYGNLLTISPPPNGNPSTGFHAQNEDNSLAWGALSSKALNAQYMATVYSGRGIYRNYDNSETGTIPSFYNDISPDQVGVKAKWDFSKYPSDLVVVNLGQNDFGPETHATPIMTDSIRFVQGYIALLDSVHFHSPQAKVLVIIGGGMSDYWPEGYKRLTRSRSWISNVVSEFEKKHPGVAKTFELKTVTPPYGEDWHPTVKAHQIMSDQVVAEIKKYMNW